MTVSLPQARTCAAIGCAVCCKLPGIPDLGKKPRHWCRHCNPLNASDGACLIYDDRPLVCRDFQCLWLRDPNFPLFMDPVSTGCMLLAETIDGRRVLRVHENRPLASRKIEGFLRNAWHGMPDLCIIVYDEKGNVSCCAFGPDGERLKIGTRREDSSGATLVPGVTKNDMIACKWDVKRVQEEADAR